jgi:hypothetical protein
MQELAGPGAISPRNVTITVGKGTYLLSSRVRKPRMNVDFRYWKECERCIEDISGL